MKRFLFLALGGAVGASAIYAVKMLVLDFSGEQFLWGTFVVNVAGSFLLGVLAAFLAFSWSPSAELRAFLVVDVLGGFITFSVFPPDLLFLSESCYVDLSAIYVIGTLVLAFGGLFAGLRPKAILT